MVQHGWHGISGARHRQGGLFGVSIPSRSPIIEPRRCRQPVCRHRRLPDCLLASQRPGLTPAPTPVSLFLGPVRYIKTNTKYQEFLPSPQQKCKDLISNHVASSPSRTAALAKFLSALANTQTDTQPKKPSSKRRRLHILYIISDTLHHTAVRQQSKGFAENLASSIPKLISLAADFSNCSKHILKLEGLIDLWLQAKYFPDSTTLLFRNALEGNVAEVAGTSAPVDTFKLAKDVPFNLPSAHGDASVPWYDLPASTWLPHITPNSTKPMYPDMMRPIQMAAGPAEKTLVSAVQLLLKNAERLYSRDGSGEDKSNITNVNELGERVVLDAVDGEVIDGDTYYGWSRAFCQRMTTRSKGPVGDDRGRSLSRSLSRPSQSYSPQRKRRRSSSSRRSRDSRRSSPDYGRKRPRSYSRSRSRSPDRGQPGQGMQPPLPPPLPPPPMNGAWQHPPPIPFSHGPPPNWTPDPGMMAQMMAAWTAAGGPPPPPPPSGPGFSQFSPNSGRGRGGSGRGYDRNDRSRGDYGRGGR